MILKIGSKGKNVEAWQRFVGVTPDGDFGEKTAEATRFWQAANGLRADGIVGANSLKIAQQMGFVVGLEKLPELGKLSEKYEVGSRGAGEVSSGVGDAGGVSYGTYQMTSKPSGGTVKRFISQADFPFKAYFAGLAPGTKDFSNAWRKANSEQGAKFAAAQHEFIKKTHFDILVRNIKAQTGFDPLTRSNALQQVIWSTAVQHGGGSKIVQNALKKSAGSDKEIIEAIYAERGRKTASGTLVWFGKNSRAVQESVANRFKAEKRDALAMLANELNF